MIEIVSPAPFLEACALLRSGFFTPPLHARAAALQLAGSDTFGLIEAGRLLAVIGFWPLGDGRDEVFLVGRGAGEVGPRLVALARACRLILADRLHSASVGVVGFVKVGHEPGRRLARLVGMSLHDGAPPGLERWELARAVHHRSTWRRQRREGSGAEPPDERDLAGAVDAGGA